MTPRCHSERCPHDGNADDDKDSSPSQAVVPGPPLAERRSAGKERHGHARPVVEASLDGNQGGDDPATEERPEPRGPDECLHFEYDRIGASLVPPEDVRRRRVTGVTRPWGCAAA